MAVNSMRKEMFKLRSGSSCSYNEHLIRCFSLKLSSSLGVSSKSGIDL